MGTQDSYSVLLKFIEQKGCFVETDFPATALTLEDANEFVRLLRSFEVRPLGIELWRRTINGYVLDGAKGWYVEGVELESEYLDAIAYLNSDWLRSDDLFVFQY